MFLQHFDSDLNPQVIDTSFCTGCNVKDRNTAIFIDIGASRYYLPVTDENRHDLELLFDLDLREPPYDPIEEKKRYLRGHRTLGELLGYPAPENKDYLPEEDDDYYDFSSL